MAFFSDFWFCAAATTLTTGALMANIFIIFVCVYKECFLFFGKKLGRAFDCFFLFFFLRNRDLFSSTHQQSHICGIRRVLKFYVFAVRGARCEFNNIFFAFDTSRYTYTTLLFILQRRSLLPLLLFYLEFLYFFIVVVVAVCATNSRRRLDRKRYLFQTWTRRMKRTFSGW